MERNLLSRSSGRNRFSIPGILCLTVVALGVSLPAGHGGDPPKLNPASATSLPAATEGRAPLQRSAASPAAEKRLREGTLLTDQAGCFRTAGDRVVFSASAVKMSMVCLENLNLERIARAITDNTEQLEWRVSGVLTEYGGANYLLVDRAILKSRADSLEDR